MRFLFTGLLFVPTLTWGQMADSNYVAGNIYVKFSDVVNIPNVNRGAVVNQAGELPFLRIILADRPVRNVEKPFFTSGSPRLQRIYKLEFAPTEPLGDVLKQLNGSPDVEYAERVPADRKLYAPNDYVPTGPNGQYSLALVRAAQAWDISRGSDNIVVAVVDDGVVTAHPDLAANLVGGRDIIYDDNDPNPDRPEDDHGTHVAGIVAARTDNGVGIASLGFSVKVMPVKIADSAGNLLRAYEGVQWAVDNGARVINMSWGGTAYSRANQDVMNYAASRGCVLVAAAGNENTTTLLYPAGYNYVIAVASTNSRDVRSSFSNYGSWIDVAAPGSSIYSTLPNSTYGFISGTSMSAPLVASLAGLMQSVNPTMNRSQVETGMKATADNIDAQNPGYVGRLGAGRINAFEAVRWAATVASTANGSWTGGNWTYQAPSAYTNPIVQAGHQITVPAGTHPVRNTIRIDGTLNLSTSAVIRIGN